TMDTLLFASLMGLYYWFARLRLGYTFSAMLLQPVVIAVFVGLSKGALTVSLPPSFAIQWLVPRLSSFNSAYPGIDVRIQAVDRQ
ncbi:LysR substrate-binding domain-containing protein, partial [Salmonella enterica subsp. enterica serovar Montevideo]|nr:LysR substrate-binding domain-containing protein [Salmonella enterica subsp. enterica serovar Montevideo]